MKRTISFVYFFAKKPFDNFDSFVFTLLLLVSVFILFQLPKRIHDERSNRDVEIALDVDEVNDLCAQNGYSFEDFLKRAAAIGAKSALVKEETVLTLGSTGKAAFFSGQEEERLRVLDILSAGSRLGANSIVIPKGDFTAQIPFQLKNRYSVNFDTSVLGNFSIINFKFNQFVPSQISESMPVGFSQEKIKYLAGLGFDSIIRIKNYGSPKWLLSWAVPDSVSGVMCYDKELPGFPGNELYFSEFVKKNRLKYISLEFFSYSGEQAFLNQAPETLVRGHTVPAEEVTLDPDTDSHIARIMRAVNERSYRFILFHFSANKNIEDNISFLRSVAQQLKRDGYALAVAKSPDYPLKYPFGILPLLILIFAVAFPVLGLMFARNLKSGYSSFAAHNAITLLGGVFVASVLYHYYYMQKIIDVPGIKTIMLATMLLSLIVLYPWQDIKNFFERDIKIKHVLAFALVSAVIGYLILRTGNNSAGTLPYEKTIRQFLEDILVVRPRTKEFLIGQPLLFLGYYYRKKFVIWLGIIGQLSIINTFLHAHTPFWISFSRSLYGIFLGFLGGMVVVGFLKLARSYTWEELFIKKY